MVMTGGWCVYGSALPTFALKRDGFILIVMIIAASNILIHTQWTLRRLLCFFLEDLLIDWCPMHGKT